MGRICFNGSAITYDAIGNPLPCDSDDDELAALNPIRYRGYYYDSETGFYYVSSRYYDPEIGHSGKAGVSISYKNVSVGPQSEVFESLNLAKRFEYEDSFYDYGISGGHSAAFLIGYHYDYSVSFLGIFTDMVNYIYTYDEEKS